MKRLIALLAVIATALVVGAQASAEQRYTDPTGDGGPGTDIADIVVNNDVTGAITFRITTVSPIVGNHALLLFIDADKNPATGGDGDEYWMFAFPAAGRFLSWNGSTFVQASPPSFRTSATGNVMEFAVNRSDLGNTAGFNFVVVSASLDGENINFWDGAPDRGAYPYDLVFPQCSNGKDDDGDGKLDAQDLGCSGTTDDNEADDPVNLKLGKATVSPARPKAGSMVRVSVPTTRVETGQPLDSGTVRCSARIVGGRALRGSGSMSNGRAQCTFRLPANAKAKTVRGEINVTYQTASARAPFSFRTAA